MKRKIILTVTFLLFIGVGISSFYFFNNNKKQPNNNSINKTSNTVKKNQEQKYIDDNDIVIGLYQEFNSSTPRQLITSLTVDWTLNKDMASLLAFASNEEEISSSNFKRTWQEYWNKYNTDGYKIGYYINFKTTDNKTIEKTILSPKDTGDIYSYIQIYLYDDINQEPGAWYSHIEEDQMTDNTILTSMKLTGSTHIDEVVVPIKVIVFTYNDTDDFDPKTNTYRGNSKYEVLINRSN